MNNSINSRILLGILEFPVSLRGAKQREQYLGILDYILGNSRFAQQAHLVYQVFLYRLDLGSCVW